MLRNEDGGTLSISFNDVPLYNRITEDSVCFSQQNLIIPISSVHNAREQTACIPHSRLDSSCSLLQLSGQSAGIKQQHQINFRKKIITVSDFTTINRRYRATVSQDHLVIPTCWPRLKTTYGSLDFISLIAKFVPLITFTFNIPINSTIPSCCYHQYQSHSKKITHEDNCIANAAKLVNLDNAACLISSILTIFFITRLSSGPTTIQFNKNLFCKQKITYSKIVPYISSTHVKVVR